MPLPDPNPFLLTHSILPKTYEEIAKETVTEELADGTIKNVRMVVTKEWNGLVGLHIHPEFYQQMCCLTKAGHLVLAHVMKLLMNDRREGNRVELIRSAITSASKTTTYKGIQELIDSKWLMKHHGEMYWVNPFRLRAYSWATLLKTVEDDLANYREKQEAKRIVKNKEIQSIIGFTDEQMEDQVAVIKAYRKAMNT